MSHKEDTSSVDFLTSDPAWRRGFEAGVVYMLMSEQHPRIYGVYSGLNSEQLFLLAHQFGYLFEWKPLDSTRIAINFTLQEVE